MPTFSICIPSYNRAHLLPGVFDNLSQQKGPSFELVIVNDGSTDDTADVLARLSRTAPFLVNAVNIPHGGLGPALNAALGAARGEFIIIMDDDDQMPPDTLARALDAWNSIPVDQRDQYCGVCGLCQFEDGKVVGDRFPEDMLTSDYFSMRMVRNIRGDKKEVLRRSCLGDFRFEVIPPERRAIKNMLWFGLARRYKTRFVNDIYLIKGRRPDGITANGRKLKVNSPNLQAEYNRSLLAWFPQAPFWLRLRFSIDYFRYRLHAGEGLAAAARKLPAAGFRRLAMPLALLAARRDRRALRRSR